MKIPSRGFGRSIVPLTLVLLGSACVSNRDGSPVVAAAARIQPGVTTKEEVLRLLGAPTDLRPQGEDAVLAFSFADNQGTGYGIGVIGMGFDVERTHAGLDWLEVCIGPDRRVKSLRIVEVPKQFPIAP